MGFLHHRHCCTTTPAIRSKGSLHYRLAHPHVSIMGGVQAFQIWKGDSPAPSLSMGMQSNIHENENSGIENTYPSDLNPFTWLYQKKKKFTLLLGIKKTYFILHLAFTMQKVWNLVVATIRNSRIWSLLTWNYNLKKVTQKETEQWRVKSSVSIMILS